MFGPLVLQQWLPSQLRDHPLGHAAGEVLVSIDPTLSDNRAVSLLRYESGPAVLAILPDQASRLELGDGESVDEAQVLHRLERAGIVLHDPDQLAYLPLEEQSVLVAETTPDRTRRLTGADATAFAAMVAEAPVAELDAAYVELDHWLVYGTFLDDRLVSAASMYPWGGTRIADLGVITLPAVRGQGLGRATVRAISAAALRQGYEPQYRCQLANAPSLALARSAGFAAYAQWQVIDC